MNTFCGAFFKLFGLTQICVGLGCKLFVMLLELRTIVRFFCVHCLLAVEVLCEGVTSF